MDNPRAALPGWCSASGRLSRSGALKRSARRLSDVGLGTSGTGAERSWEYRFNPCENRLTPRQNAQQIPDDREVGTRPSFHHVSLVQPRMGRQFIAWRRQPQGIPNEPTIILSPRGGGRGNSRQGRRRCRVARADRDSQVSALGVGLRSGAPFRCTHRIAHRKRGPLSFYCIGSPSRHKPLDVVHL